MSDLRPMHRRLRQRASFFMLAMAWLPASIAQDVSVTSEGFSSQSTRDGWTYTRTFSGVEGFAARPDDASTPSINVHWEQPKLDALGNICGIRGRLEYTSEGAAEPRPVDWFQGVALYVAKAPGAAPDWSMGMNRRDTLSETVTCDPSGEFKFTFDLRDTQDDRALSEWFQVGLVLARHVAVGERGQEVTWDSHAPAIAESVRMLEIPAAPAMSHELELINQAAEWPFGDPNSEHLIRAVNALQPLGKDEALGVLEKYIELSDSQGPFEGDIAFWIIRLLFEPVGMDDRIPPPRNAVYFAEEGSPEDMAWPLNPLGLVEGVPFMLGSQIALGGFAEPPQSHVEWARRHCVIRDAPLEPTINPLVAAEMITADAMYQRSLEGDEGWTALSMHKLRRQALSMVDGLVPPIPADVYDTDEFEQEWRDRLEQSIELGITWDADRQEFVAGGLNDQSPRSPP